MDVQARAETAELPGMLPRGTLCRTCYEACRKHFPSLKTTGEVRGFLWGATGYPTVDCNTVCKHLEEFGRKSGGDCGLAVAMFNEAVERDMQEAWDKEKALTAIES